MGRLIKQTLLLILLNAFLFCSTACGIVPASTDENSLVRWSELPITYHISHEISEEYQKDIHAAFDEWERSLNTDVFKFGGVVNLGESELENDHHTLKNVIFATNGSGHVKTKNSDNIDAIARTFVRGSSSIRDTDVVLFGFEQNYIHGRGEYGDVYSVYTVMLHEIGRMLFGDNDPSDSASVMKNPVYPKGHPEEKIALSDSDIDLFYEVYGELL